MVNIDFKFRVAARLVLLLCLVGMVPSALGQGVKTMLVEPPVPLLPQQVGKWVKGAPSGADGGAAPADNSEAQVLAEDGLQRSERGTYHLASNPARTIAVVAHQFVDATGAHAAYSYYLRPGAQYRGPKIGDETADNYLFRSGTTVVSADSKISRSETDVMLSALSAHLPKVGGPKGLAPLLPTLLPAKGLKSETVKYALGPAGYQAMGGVLPGGMVGFDKSAEVAMAQYAGEGTLTLLLYPTPQIAGDRGRAIEAEMNRRGAAAGTVKLRREGPLLAMTTGAWNPKAAEKMVEGVHLHDRVTWNKTPPLEFKSEVRKTASLLMSIAIFSGILALAAIVLGFFLGFGRAAIRVMQGKPAATEPEFLRIDLSGQSAKIHMEGPGPPSNRR